MVSASGLPVVTPTTICRRTLSNAALKSMSSTAAGVWVRKDHSQNDDTAMLAKPVSRRAIPPYCPSRKMLPVNVDSRDTRNLWKILPKTLVSHIAR